MRGYSVVVVSSFFGVVFGMEKEQALIQLMRKDIIPVLAFNNYVVYVPNAYQALKKEAFLFYAVMEAMQKIFVKQINKSGRESLKQNAFAMYKVHTAPSYNEAMRRIGYSSYKYIQIICEPSSEVNDEMVVSIQTNSFIYPVYREASKKRPYLNKKDIKGNVSRFLKAMIEQSLFKDRPVYIEICSQNKISDWVKIESFLEPSNVALPIMPLSENTAFLCERDIDYVVTDMQNLERLSHVILVACAVLVGAVLGLSLY